MPKIRLVDQIPTDIKEKIEQELISYEKSHGIDINYKSFSLLLKENDKIIGALNAYTAFAEIYIDDMWIAEDNRSLGFGKKLLCEIDKILKTKASIISIFSLISFKHLNFTKNVVLLWNLSEKI